MLYGVQFAAVNILDGNRCQIHIEEAADVDAPFVRSCPRATKRQDAAHWTEVVGGNFRVPSVCGQCLDGSEQPQLAFTYAVYECTAPTTYRAIAHPHVIKISVNLELNLAAVATAAVRLLHGV